MAQAESTAWSQFVDAAISSDDPVRLLHVCFAYSEVVEPSLFAARTGGCPAGRPNRADVRRAAAVLVDDTSPADDADADWKRAVGHLHLWSAPTGDEDGDEARAAVDACIRGLALAESSGDLDLACWAGWVLAETRYKVADHAGSLSAADSALSLLGQLRDAGAGRLEFASRAGAPSWMPSPHVWRTVLMALLAKRLQLAASAVGDYDVWTSAWEARQALAPDLKEARPLLYAKTIQAIAGRARIQGDRHRMADALRQLEELKEISAPRDRFEIERVLSATRVGNAESLKDWQTCRDGQLDRLTWALQAMAEQAKSSGDDIDQDTVGNDLLTRAERVLTWLRAHGDRAWSAAIGNCALGAATATYRLGHTQHDEAEWQRAWSLLDLADRAYDGFGSNGFVAVRLTRNRLLHYAPGGARQDLARTIAAFLEVSQVGKAATMRRNAVINAVEVCTRDEHTVMARLDEMIEQDALIHGPRLRAARVMLRRKAASVDPVALEAEALSVAADLEQGGRLVDAVLATEAWAAAAAAAGSLDRPLDVQLERQLQAIRCLSTQLVSVTSPAERRELGIKYSELIRSAADLAVELGDARAAEVIMEATRRDQVGAVLVSLIRDPAVSDSVRVAAEALQLSNSVIPTAPGEVRRDDVRAWVGRSADEQVEAQEQAARLATSVVGPLAALADTRTLPRARARHLIAATPRGSAAAVLQLLPANVGFLATDDRNQQRLFWSVSMVAPDGTMVEDCGVSDLPAEPDELRAPASFWHAYYMSESLVPEVLRDFLLEHGAAQPVRLTVVPTGLLGVPFDTLSLGSGLQVVDRAAVSLVGSIASAIALAEIDLVAEDGKSWLAVFDTERLPATGRELEALKDAHHPVVETSGALGLLSMMDGTSSTLAMGVHGSHDRVSGWGQTKLLPDGTTVSALDILRRHVPRHCVLASCHSTLVAASDVELGGFPMALLLRGAKSIVGSTYEIPDAVSAELMSHYWRKIGAGLRPDLALRAAKEAVLGSDDALRSSPEAWAAVVLYGQS